MSRGGRLSGRGRASSGLRAVANALGIARHEMGSYTKVVLESQPTYPVSSECIIQSIRKNVKKINMLHLLSRVADFQFLPSYFTSLGNSKFALKYRDKRT